jgi:hypothetical protein
MFWDWRQRRATAEIKQRSSIALRSSPPSLSGTAAVGSLGLGSGFTLGRGREPSFGTTNRDSARDADAQSVAVHSGGLLNPAGDLLREVYALAA